MYQAVPTNLLVAPTTWNGRYRDGSYCGVYRSLALPTMVRHSRVPVRPVTGDRKA
ncbi:hypothetical protein IG631_20997 [Alternaria alternata]|nr:hypothetical protein IG631_20997 [Alternaria alternata]